MKRIADTGLGLRVRALRKGLGLTQEQLADAGGLRRVEVVRVETGGNKASSHAIRKGLARGFGLSREELDALLDDQLGVADALRLSTREPVVAKGEPTGAELQRVAAVYRETADELERRAKD